MIALSNPRTGHKIKVDEASAEFWRNAGYREIEPAKPAKKATAKKSSARKTSK